MSNELSVSEKVLISRVHEEVDKSLQFQIELNKLAEERDHYKAEYEKLIEKEEPTDDKN